jgi:uncharacterized protein (DUF302 family)
MIKTLNVESHEHVSERGFDDVIAAFKKATGSVEEGFAAIASDAHSPEDFERIFKAREGSSGFMRFLSLDHGSWLSNFGQPKKAIMSVIGNPLIAVTMLKHDIGGGLDVPVRLYIYEGDDGKARVTYDLPSTLMGGLHNADVTDAARKLDAKLIALAEDISGVSA